MYNFYSLFLAIVFSLISINTFACSCGNQGVDINNFFITSDYVAFVQITDVEDSSSPESNFHTIRIKTMQKFKGKIASEIKVHGNRGHGIISCTLSPNIDEYWVIFAAENAEGVLEFGYCSGSKELRERSYFLAEDRWIDNDYRLLVETLNFLSKNTANINRDFYLKSDTSEFYSFMRKYQGESFQSSFGQYLLTLDKNLNVVAVKTLKGLGSSFDKDITSFLLDKSKWAAENRKITDEFSYVLGVYYDENDQSLSLGPLYNFY